MKQGLEVLIVGLGLIGGSYAKGLAAKGYHVTAIDTNHSSIEMALEGGFIEKGATVANVDLISQADLIIFGVYPLVMKDWVVEHQAHFKSGAVVTDVLGVKRDIVEKMETLLREDVYYVGSHPMAGKEVSGVAYSDPNMFKKANFIVTPTEKTSQKALEVVEQMARDLEFKKISHLSPEQHDKVIGFLSQLTHVIAVSLMNCCDNESYVHYTGDSFRDLTRIAMINENLWFELFVQNKQCLLDEMDGFIAEMQEFRDILYSEDEKAMKEKFITSTNRRMKYL